MAGVALTNARLYSGPDWEPVPGALVIQDGVIVHVGDLESVPSLDGVAVHDLGGRTVIPGFIDAHTHPGMVAASDWHVRLPWTTDVDEILDFVRDYARAHPVEEAPFLYFEYYPTAAFIDRQPTKEILDSAVSDRPCLCQDFSEHAHWVNSRMLELMGITRDTPDPVPGLEMFVRDEHGEPTGLLREGVHWRFLDRLYERIGWKPPEEMTPERVGRVLRFLTEHGVTALFDALVDDEGAVAAVAELDRRGELDLYYEGAVRFRNLGDLPEAIARLRRLQETYGGDRIRLNALKLFLDGTNEGGNSALLTPLCDHQGEGELGEIAMDAAELADCLELTSSAGVDVHIHLVGDRAFRVACDAVQLVQSRLRDLGEPWRSQVTLAHCELVDPADMGRPAELGILVNWTPHWSGGYFGEGSQAYLGQERWDRMYRFNEIADSGALVTFGSDVVTQYELQRARPLYGMQIAHTRVDPEYPLDPTAYPDSVRPEAAARLSRRLLFEGYTINAARQLRVSDRMGSLEVGKSANLSVLAEDPFEVDAARLGSVAVDAVLFEGRVVHGSL